jgi:hypothetical protein
VQARTVIGHVAMARSLLLLLLLLLLWAGLVWAHTWAPPAEVRDVPPVVVATVAYVAVRLSLSLSHTHKHWHAHTLYQPQTSTTRRLRGTRVAVGLHSDTPEGRAAGARWVAQLAAVYADDHSDGSGPPPLLTRVDAIAPADVADVANVADGDARAGRAVVPALHVQLGQAVDRACLLAPPPPPGARIALPLPVDDANMAAAVALLNRHLHRHRTPTGALTPRVPG